MRRDSVRERPKTMSWRRLMGRASRATQLPSVLAKSIHLVWIFLQGLQKWKCFFFFPCAARGLLYQDTYSSRTETGRHAPAAVAAPRPAAIGRRCDDGLVARAAAARGSAVSRGRGRVWRIAFDSMVYRAMQRYSYVGGPKGKRASRWVGVVARVVVCVCAGVSGAGEARRDCSWASMCVWAAKKRPGCLEINRRDGC